jgi:integrase/recombinase XerD
MVNGGDFVIALRQSGVKPVSCNTYIRGVNCFLSWLHASGLLEPKLAIKQLRVEKTIPKILDGSALSRLIGYKPACMSQRRVHAIALMVIDAGLRISEVISLRAADIDMDTMVLRVMGKGRKERMMPFSPELRRVLFRYMESYPQLSGGYVFGSEGRSMPGYRNLLRDYHLMLSNIASTVWVGFIGSVILSLVPICSGAAINSIFNECSGTRT